MRQYSVQITFEFFFIILYYIFLSFRMFNLDLWAVWKKCENEEQQLANGAKIQKMVSFPVQKKLSLDTFLGPMVVTSWPKEDIALAWTLTSLCKLNLAIFLVWKIMNPIKSSVSWKWAWWTYVQAISYQQLNFQILFSLSFSHQNAFR